MRGMKSGRGPAQVWGRKERFWFTIVCLVVASPYLIFAGAAAYRWWNG